MYVYTYPTWFYVHFSLDSTPCYNTGTGACTTNCKDTNEVQHVHVYCCSMTVMQTGPIVNLPIHAISCRVQTDPANCIYNWNSYCIMSLYVMSQLKTGDNLSSYHKLHRHKRCTSPISHALNTCTAYGSKLVGIV